MISSTCQKKHMYNESHTALGSGHLPYLLHQHLMLRDSGQSANVMAFGRGSRLLPLSVTFNSAF